MWKKPKFEKNIVNNDKIDNFFWVGSVKWTRFFLNTNPGKKSFKNFQIFKNRCKKFHKNST